MIEHDFPEVRKIVEAEMTRKPINDYELIRYSVAKEVRKAIEKIGGTMPFCGAIKIRICKDDKFLFLYQYGEEKKLQRFEIYFIGGT